MEPLSLDALAVKMRVSDALKKALLSDRSRPSKFLSSTWLMSVGEMESGEKASWCGYRTSGMSEPRVMSPLLRGVLVKMKDIDGISFRDGKDSEAVLTG